MRYLDRDLSMSMSFIKAIPVLQGETRSWPNSMHLVSVERAHLSDTRQAVLTHPQAILSALFSSMKDAWLDVP